MTATKRATKQPRVDEPYKSAILLGKEVRYFPATPGWALVDGEWVSGVPAMMIRIACVALTADRFSMVECLTEARAELASACATIGQLSEQRGYPRVIDIEQCDRLRALTTKIDGLGQ